MEEHLRRFAEGGRVDASDDRIDVRVGSARFAVTRHGGVDTGMPLHEFSAADAEALVFDHDGGAIRIEGDDVRYEFRRP